MDEKSKRVLEAEAADRAELAAAVAPLIRTEQDAADWMIAEYEAATGNIATEEDRAEALRTIRERGGL